MAAAFLVAGTTVSAAADYPSKTITVMVPHAAGGPTDTVARLVGESMTRTLGQQLIVEKGWRRRHAGYRSRLQGRPDGYTLLLHHGGTGVKRLAVPQAAVRSRHRLRRRRPDHGCR